MKLKFVLPLLLIFFFGRYLSAQIGIGTDTPSAVSLIDIQTVGKGILLPQISLTSRSSYAPIQGTPTEHLMVYNTNSLLGKGYFYWDAGENKWTPLLNIDDAPIQLSLTQNYIATGTTPITITGFNPGEVYNIGSTDSRFTTLPGMSKTFTLLGTKNDINVVADGYGQINSGFTPTTNVTYAVGIFIDNILTFVKIFTSTPIACAYTKYHISGSVNNLSVGTHTIEIRVRNRVNGGGAGATSYTYQGNSSGCTNIDANSLTGSLNIEIKDAYPN